jgi:chemotaxis-related protein WspD
MMPAETDKPGLEKPPAEACWDRIGVRGDRRCVKLATAGHCRNCSVFSEAGQELFDREALPEYLDEWTRQLAAADSAAVADTVSWLLFRVGPEWLALEARCVVEVLSPRPIHRVPHRTNRLLLGLANIRGELQLCASLRELLGIEVPPAGIGRTASRGRSRFSSEPPSPDPSFDRPSVGARRGDIRDGPPRNAVGAQPRMIVAECEQRRWVLPVDEVDGVLQAAAGAMEELPCTVERSAQHYCQALFCHGHKKVGLLSAVKLFQALERTVR